MMNNFGHFDSIFSEYENDIDGHFVRVYKIGGGTPGRRYSGNWAYEVSIAGAVIISGTDFTTGWPYTHHEVSLAVLDYIGIR